MIFQIYKQRENNMPVQKTSLDAYQSGIPHETNKDKVYNMVKSHQYDGATNSDLCTLLRLTPNSISPRLQELERDGLIIKLRQERVNKRTKRYQNVYVCPQYVDNRPVVPFEDTRTKQVEKLLRRIHGKLERKGCMNLTVNDEIHREIKELLV